MEEWREDLQFGDLIFTSHQITNLHIPSWDPWHLWQVFHQGRICFLNLHQLQESKSDTTRHDTVVKGPVSPVYFLDYFIFVGLNIHKVVSPFGMAAWRKETICTLSKTVRDEYVLWSSADIHRHSGPCLLFPIALCNTLHEADITWRCSHPQKECGHNQDPVTHSASICNSVWKSVKECEGDFKCLQISSLEGSSWRVYHVSWNFIKLSCVCVSYYECIWCM